MGTKLCFGRSEIETHGRKQCALGKELPSSAKASNTQCLPHCNFMRSINNSIICRLMHVQDCGGFLIGCLMIIIIIIIIKTMFIQANLFSKMNLLLSTKDL